MERNTGLALRYAILAATIRLALAPFFMHTWDVTTLLESTQQFLNGINPYQVVISNTVALRGRTSLPLSYEGYTYLPTMLYIYAPFVAIYNALFKAPPIVNGHRVDILEINYPNIFFSLMLLKMPIILADSAAAYLLAKKNSRIGLMYALSPYTIVITSFWGHFDPLIGVMLLISCLMFDKNPFFSGIAYGVSLTKLYTIVALPAYIVNLRRRPVRQAIAFVLGAVISLIPTIYFVTVSADSFIGTLLYHGSRPIGGMNVYTAVSYTHLTLPTN